MSREVEYPPTLPGEAEQSRSELWRAAPARSASLEKIGFLQMGYLKIYNTVCSAGAARHNSSSLSTDPILALRAITQTAPTQLPTTATLTSTRCASPSPAPLLSSLPA